MSNHDRRILSENPGVYTAMKSIGPPPSHFQAYPLMQLTPTENDEKLRGLLVNYVFGGHMWHQKRSPLVIHLFQF